MDKYFSVSVGYNAIVIKLPFPDAALDLQHHVHSFSPETIGLGGIVDHEVVE